MEIRYRQPARYDDEVRLITTTEKLTPVRIDHRYQLFRGHDLLTDGSSTLVCVGRDGRPQGVPDDVFAAMTRAAELSESAR